jgi:hypothetical protein
MAMFGPVLQMAEGRITVHTMYFFERHMDNPSFQISLRISHLKRSAADISRLLEMLPHVARNVGEERISPDGRVLGVNSRSFCVFDLTERQEGWFTDGLEKLLPALRLRKPAMTDLVMEGGSAEIYVGIFLNEAASSSGFSLKPELMEELAKLSLELTVELYTG